MIRPITKVQHPLRVRRVAVREVSRPTRHVARVVFAGDDLADFVSGAPEDHVKVFFPAPGAAEPVMPTLGPDGPSYPAGSPPPIMRDYTPLAWDHDARTLTIEFALHGDGPAAAWASQARPGDVVGVAGPRGSAIVPPDYAGYLLVGDESSLPAISRRLAELPAGVAATVVLAVEGPEDERPLPSAADVSVTWLHRGATPPGEPGTYLPTLRGLALPPAPFFTWLSAGEPVVLAAREALFARGVEHEHLLAKAYWK